MRAVGYIRSRPDPPIAGELPGVELEEPPAEAIERYCAEEFHQLVEMLDPRKGDAISGDGDGFGVLVDRFTGPSAKPALVVIPDSSHLADTLEVFVERLLLLRRLNADVRCAELNLPDPIQNALERLSLEGRSVDRERGVREAIMAKAARGEVLGKTPFGYEAGVDGLLRPVESEARVVADIFGWYAGLVGEDGSSLYPETSGIGLRRIAYLLNRREIHTRQGNPWTPMSVRNVLKNRAYIGVYSRLGLRLVRNHPPIVDRGVFNRAQELLAARRPQPVNAGPSRFLLSRLARCQACGRALNGITRNRSWRRADGREHSRAYRYYECPARRRYSAAAVRDMHPVWRAERLEESVLRELSRWSRGRAARTLRASRIPGGNLDVSEAERHFMRTTRDVAAGRKTLGDLGVALDALRSARSGRSSDRSSTMTIGEAVREAGSGDSAAARAALNALLRRIVVGHSDVQLLSRA